MSVQQFDNVGELPPWLEFDGAGVERPLISDNDSRNPDIERRELPTFLSHHLHASCLFQELSGWLKNSQSAQAAHILRGCEVVQVRSQFTEPFEIKWQWDTSC